MVEAKQNIHLNFILSGSLIFFSFFFFFTKGATYLHVLLRVMWYWAEPGGKDTSLTIQKLSLTLPQACFWRVIYSLLQSASLLLLFSRPWSSHRDMTFSLTPVTVKENTWETFRMFSYFLHVFRSQTRKIYANFMSNLLNRDTCM